jgi:hypothetical protein
LEPCEEGRVHQRHDGIGKTTTCGELRKLLPRNVFLDGDWCWEMRAFVVTEETRRWCVATSSTG